MLPTPPASPPTRNTLCSPEDRLGQILAGRLRLTSILGIGAYGVVYTGQDVHTGVMYAVKALDKIGLDPKQRKFQQREIQLHYHASQHPNVVSLVKIMDSPDCTFVVVEYCPEGDLFTNITEHARYVGDDQLVKRVFLQILDAVEFCHSIGIYHRDLKPENILVKNHGTTVKLADFGLATSDYITSDFGCGSTFYMSPECQQTSPKAYSCYASAPNDVWSLGVILVNLTCGRNPWKRASLEDSTFRAYMEDPSFLRSILPISPDLDRILRRIFECNPALRITIPELREMILHCPSFTTWSPPPQILPPSPFHSCYQDVLSQYSQPVLHPVAVAFANPPIMPPPHTPLSVQCSQLSASSGGAHSDSGSVFSLSSSASSNSSVSSLTHVDATAKTLLPMVPQSEQQHYPYHHLAGLRSRSSPWKNLFCDQVARHLSIQHLSTLVPPVC